MVIPATNGGCGVQQETEINGPRPPLGQPQQPSCWVALFSTSGWDRPGKTWTLIRLLHHRLPRGPAFFDSWSRVVYVQPDHVSRRPRAKRMSFDPSTTFHFRLFVFYTEPFVPSNVVR